MRCIPRAGAAYSGGIAAQKANVLLVGRDAVKLQAACDALRAAHGGCDLDYIACDLCSEESVVLLSQRLFEQPGSLDLIVQAVGESDRGELQKLEVSRLESLFQKNVVSGLLTIKHLTPLLAPKGELAAGGVLVFIGSLSSHFAPRFLGGYSIVKHGVAARPSRRVWSWHRKGSMCYWQALVPSHATTQESVTSIWPMRATCLPKP